MFKSGIIVFIGMLLGRFAGFARELVLAKQAGAGHIADIAILGLTLPDLIIGLLVGGASNIVFIPIFQSLNKEKKLAAFLSFSAVFFVLFSIAALILFFNLDSLIYLLAPGLSLDYYPLARNYLSISIVSIPILSLVAVSRALLQSDSHFYTTSTENFIFNLVLIVGLFLSLSPTSLGNFGWFLVIGAGLRYLAQWCEVAYRYGFKLKLYRGQKLFTSYFWRSYGEALGGGAALILLPIVFRSFISTNGEGYLAIFNYAYKLVELPVGIIFVSFSTVLFPKFLSLITDKSDKLSGTIQMSIWAILSITSATSLGLISISLYAVKLDVNLFSIRSELSNILIYMACIWLAVLPLRALSSMNLSLFSSHRDTRRPFQINLLVLTIAFVLCLLSNKGWLDLALLYSFCYILMFIIETLFLKKLHNINILQYVVTFKNGLSIVLAMGLFYLCYHLVSSYSLPLLYAFILHLVFGSIYLLILYGISRRNVPVI